MVHVHGKLALTLTLILIPRWDAEQLLVLYLYPPNGSGGDCQKHWITHLNASNISKIDPVSQMVSRVVIASIMSHRNRSDFLIKVKRPPLNPKPMYVLVPALFVGCSLTLTLALILTFVVS